jgi:hypothetical protein
VPPPPTPTTVMRGVKSVCVVCGIIRFRVIENLLEAIALENASFACQTGMQLGVDVFSGEAAKRAP